MLKIKVIFDSSTRVVPRATSETSSFGLTDVLSFAHKRFNIPETESIHLTATDDEGNRLAVATDADLTAAIAYATHRNRRSLKLYLGFDDDEESSSTEDENRASASDLTTTEEDESASGISSGEEEQNATGAPLPAVKVESHDFELIDADQRPHEPVWVKYRRAARQRQREHHGHHHHGRHGHRGHGRCFHRHRENVDERPVAVCPHGKRYSKFKSEKNESAKSRSKLAMLSKKKAQVDKLKGRLAAKKEKIHSIRGKLNEQRAVNRQLVKQIAELKKEMGVGREGEDVCPAKPAVAVAGGDAAGRSGCRRRHRQIRGFASRHD